LIDRCTCVEGRNPRGSVRGRGSRGRSRDKVDHHDNEDEDDAELSWIEERPSSDRYLPPAAGGAPLPDSANLPGQLWTETGGRERWIATRWRLFHNLLCPPIYHHSVWSVTSIYV